MKKLPMNDRELNKVVFKGSSVYEPRALSDYFTLGELVTMLDNGDFTWPTRTWMFNALDAMYTKLGY